MGNSRKKKQAWQIEVFTSGEALIEAVKELDVIFLDIEMPELDGIETGRMIRKMNPCCKIIMATGKVERFKEAFHIQAFRFITKPFDMEEIEEALQAVENVTIGNTMLEVSYHRSGYEVKQRQIRYIQAFNGIAELTIDNVVMRKEISLEELEQLLDKRIFVRIHRQFIVNLCWVDSYKNGVVSVGGEKIKISRRRKKDFEEKYVYYDIHYR